MFTDTSIATQASNGMVFGNLRPFVLTTDELFQNYRQMAYGLIDITNPELFYKVYENAPGSHNGYGVHEKIIHNGMSVIDVSFGRLDFPWSAADANQFNEISYEQLQVLANNELNSVVSPRLRAIATFAASLPPYTHYYHYVGRDGVRALTIDDELNAIKFNCILTQQFMV